MLRRGVYLPPSQFESWFVSAAHTAKDIEVLEGLEPVRRRPGMYIGGTDTTALHHLAAEILDNSMDEAVAGFAKLCGKRKFRAYPSLTQTTVFARPIFSTS